MANVIEIIPEIAGAALVIEPELVGIPVVGRILIALSAGHGSETQAMQELEAQAVKRKTERQTRKDRNARYVLKASDAMQCVEDHLMDGKLLLSLGKGLVNALIGSKAGFAPDILLDGIWTCIEEKVLRQDSPRVITTERRYHRPSRGHGKGRGTF